MSNAGKFGTNSSVYRQGKQVSSDFKVTVLGLTPSDWDVATLEALSEKIMVGIASAATHAYRDRGVPFLRNQNILPNKLDVSDILYVSPEYEVSFQNKRLKAGDLLTARTGYPGTTCMIPDAFEGAQSFTTLITRLKTDRVLPEFVCAFMNSEQGQKFFELNQIGGGQKNVNSSILKTFPLPIPQLPEQTAIANALSDVDALIQELEKLIVKKQAIKTATMQQLLTGRTRLPQFAYHPDGRKKGYKPSELGEIPEDWEVYSLSSICDVRDGTHDSPKYRDNGIPLVTSKNIVNDVLDLTDVSLISIEDASEINKRSKVDKGDIIMSMIGTVGSAVLLRQEPEFCIKNVALFKPRSVLGEFLVQLIRSKFFQDYLVNSMDGGIQKFVSLGTLRNMQIALPIKDEQSILAEIMCDMDEEIQALEQRLFKTRQIKQGMMQELLTGKTRLVKPTGAA
ncbi:restriction endonuclease subunit S [Shewanella xiamenensis]|uniref:restriction endonuclease subunit S n=1 Tax=Shewanella xiamenensis TaxID=332186 RepID=UPI00313E133C